jgi:ATP-dependent Clp protease ATP-binding subunit ClpA
VFERFTQEAREAVVAAQHEAAGLHHSYLGTEHLLLGLFHGSDSGARALHHLGVEAEDVRSALRRIVGEGPEWTAPVDDEEALRSIGIDLDEVRRRVEDAFGPGALDVSFRRGRGGRRRCGPVTGHLPFTPRAKKVLELSLREAIRLGHGSIGTGHILLGLAREGEGLAMRILVERGVTVDAIRTAVAEEICGGGSRSA